MNLEQNGLNRLAAIKKALSAGLPLAGLLTATGCGSATPGGPAPTAGNAPCPPPAQAVSPALDEGEIPITEEFVTEGLLLAPEDAPEEVLSNPDSDAIPYRTKGVPVAPPAPPAEP